MDFFLISERWKYGFTNEAGRQGWEEKLISTFNPRAPQSSSLISGLISASSKIASNRSSMSSPLLIVFLSHDFQFSLASCKISDSIRGITTDKIDCTCPLSASSELRRIASGYL